MELAASKHKTTGVPVKVVCVDSGRIKRVSLSVSVGREGFASALGIDAKDFVLEHEGVILNDDRELQAVLEQHKQFSTKPVRLTYSQSHAPARPDRGIPPSSLVFHLNGVEHTVTEVNPQMSLLDYLRDVASMTGTKKSCAEGGCGACTVLLQTDPTQIFKSINACLRPLCSVNGQSIKTIESVGGNKEGYSAVQQKVAACNGSQCGFCTPGNHGSRYRCYLLTSIVLFQVW
jgi:aerobic-type carbon monoxide dehydrogenase small subunit (CoxS/CutS family)